MRILKNGNTVGILVAPGNELITDDAELLEFAKQLGNTGKLPVQAVINHFQQGGYTVRGAYQVYEGASSREKEMQLFHTMAHHEVAIEIATVEDSKPKPRARNEEEAIAALEQEKRALEIKINELENLADAATAEANRLADAFNTEKDKGEGSWFKKIFKK